MSSGNTIQHSREAAVPEVLRVCGGQLPDTAGDRQPTRGSTLLDLLFVNREGLASDVKTRGHIGHRNHEMIEFSVVREEEG